MFKKYLIVFLISMIPLIELRGAIPVGLSEAFGPACTGVEQVVILYIIAVLGNMLPVPLIFFFARKVLIWGSDKKVIGKFFKFCLEKGEKGGKKLQEKAGRGLYFALFLFVGIPLPGTGVWVGTLAASLLNMDFKKSSIAVMRRSYTCRYHNGISISRTIRSYWCNICKINKTSDIGLSEVYFYPSIVEIQRVLSSKTSSKTFTVSNAVNIGILFSTAHLLICTPSVS